MYIISVYVISFPNNNEPAKLQKTLGWLCTVMIDLHHNNNTTT